MKKIFSIFAFALLVLNAYPTNYYFSSTGVDGNDGKSPAQAWVSFSKLQGVALQSGDSILLKSGDVFATTQNIKLYKWVYKGADNTYGTGDDVAYGNVLVSSPTSYIVITTYPATGSAANIRYLKDTTGIELYNVQGIKIMNLNMTGMGIGSKPVYNGVSIFNDDAYGIPGTDTLQNYYLNKLSVGGFKTGIIAGTWGGQKTKGITFSYCDSHDNFVNGISTFAESTGQICNITIQHCKAYGNSGDQNAILNTGSGIVIGDSYNALVEKCIAYNNGFYCNASDGPVGIWTYNSTKVTIGHCESYNNKTAGPADGNGFDIDGGSQQCIIQYCYSHGNEGAGYLICQYAGARAFNNNIIRYNISQNDGSKNGYGGIHFYSSGSNGGITSTEIYNNTIFNNVSSVVKFQVTAGISGVKIRNNIFDAGNNKSLVIGNPSTAVAKFENNLYWTNGGTFDISGYANLNNWRIGSGQEMKSSLPTGINADPKLTNPGNGTTVNNADYLDTLTAYKLKVTSPLLNSGQNLTLPGNGSLNVGVHDFYGVAIPYKTAFDIGSHEYTGVWPSIAAASDTLYIDGLQGSTNTLSIASNVSYKFTYSAPWLSVSPTTASGNQTITFTATQINIDGVQRSDRVIISKNDGSVADNDTVYVIQKSTYTVSFSITDIDNIPIKNAAITIGTLTKWTDINGKATFTLISGNYDYILTRPGYETIPSSPFILGNGNLAMQIKMTAILYKVYFSVKEGANPIGSARVSVGTTSNETNGSGIASFIMLTGSYNFNVTKTGYYTIPNTPFTVINDTTITINLVPIPPTVYNITLKIVDDTTPIPDATVKIDTTVISTSDSGLSVFNLSNGNYKYSILKPGYDSVSLAPFSVKNKDTIIIVQMKKAHFAIQFMVSDGTKPVMGAKVSIDTMDVTTDALGIAAFSLVNGKYDYNISKSGYDSIGSTVIVKDSARIIHIMVNKAALTVPEESISAYPVPTQGPLTLKGSMIIPGAIIQVYSISGTLIQSITATGTERISIDLGNLPGGIYIIKVSSGQNSRYLRIAVE